MDMTQLSYVGLVLQCTPNWGSTGLPTSGRTNKDHCARHGIHATKWPLHAEWACPAGQSSLDSSRIAVAAQLRENLPILIADLDLFQQIRPVLQRLLQRH